MTEQNEDQPLAETEEAKQSTLQDLLVKYEGSPDAETIEGWKRQYGEIFCSAFSETEIFIWRPLNRSEWTQNQLALSRAEGQVDPFQIEEDVVRSCILWTSDSGEKSLVDKAGSVSTLHEQLLQNSNFVDPRLASSLVVKL